MALFGRSINAHLLHYLVHAGEVGVNEGSRIPWRDWGQKKFWDPWTWQFCMSFFFVLKKESQWFKLSINLINSISLDNWYNFLLVMYLEWRNVGNIDFLRIMYILSFPIWKSEEKNIYMNNGHVYDDSLLLKQLKVFKEMSVGFWNGCPKSTSFRKKEPFCN